MSDFLLPPCVNTVGGNEKDRDRDRDRDRERDREKDRDRERDRDKLKMRKRENMWYFTAEELANSPSRANGIGADQELSYRQMTAYLIQEMGQRLQVYVLIIL